MNRYSLVIIDIFSSIAKQNIILTYKLGSRSGITESTNQPEIADTDLLKNVLNS